MPVEKTMRTYRTTEREKALGKTKKSVLIKYLNAVKAQVGEAEISLAESERERAKEIAEAKAEIEAWNTKYRNLSAKIIRAELSRNKKSLAVPSCPRDWYSWRNQSEEKRTIDSLSISVEARKHKEELEKLLERQPRENVYYKAECEADTGRLSADSFSPYSYVGLRMVGSWVENIDALIADLESRASTDVYTAQVMQIKHTVETVLSRFSLTPQVRKTIRKKKEKG